ncbi:methionyl-tRNA formyltransferase family protein, putative [Aspergillus fumigatus A1163]|uniref:methionyl-tRNA formyltransferase n=2 Tax=Aspergillus fumigatus TaxID=746128 RepID=Q4WNB7_ASPFU|nr:methionyl-tRNA formyltransferase family protein, putative [Aspergillus fumigatus Af293]EAL88547.2 methionyl-tRNA formyltransferase family protein, putative [Aspergillus fumigatus Af293]EDP49259.1 methionyl-tRNA formyltransferase family protein, putative [Aspergillus fumigatus A1163]
MAHFMRAGALRHHRSALSKPSFGYRFLATKTYDPLRILFCGADEFSIASLKALHEEHVRRPDRISSIDVVCRPGKRVGRVPIKAVATELSLPIHEIDTFKGWAVEYSPRRLVAVSFGLFVPPRILNAAKYGGLNVHPSLLPDFRGPAPLHHTLLAGRTKTGVTLQTLHVKHFDHGVILQQTPAPGFEIPNPDTCTVPELLNIVAPKGAEILLDGIRKGLFVPPIEDAGWRASQGDEPLIHAAKIKPEDRHIDWVNWTWKDISRRNRVLGPLWNKTLAVSDPTSGNPLFRQRRVILSEMEEVDTIKGCEAFSLIPGLPFVDSAHPIDRQQGKGLYVFTRDGKLIQIYQMKVEGEQNADGVRAALKARMLSDRTFHSGAADFTPFHNPLQ